MDQELPRINNAGLLVGTLMITGIIMCMCVGGCESRKSRHGGKISDVEQETRLPSTDTDPAVKHEMLSFTGRLKTYDFGVHWTTLSFEDGGRLYLKEDKKGGPRVLTLPQGRESTWHYRDDGRFVKMELGRPEKHVEQKEIFSQNLSLQQWVFNKIAKNVIANERDRKSRRALTVRQLMAQKIVCRALTFQRPSFGGPSP